MIVSIQFDDSNRELAEAIGTGLCIYGSGGQVPVVPAERVDEAAPETPVEVVKTEPVVELTPGASVTPIVRNATADADTNGVMFDPEYCGKAKDPFYGAGKRTGQWKKLRGLDDATYDAWYADRLRNLAPPPLPQAAPVVGGPPVVAVPQAVPAAAPPVTDTTAAFGGQPEPAPVDDDDVPTGAGQLMKWISEQMNAGHLTQADVDSAYVTADVTPAQLFSDDPSAVGTLYSVLKASLS